MLKSRRYRNRRLGDFLKELDLTEGRSTGVPTIQAKLAENGSPRAIFETTDDRLTFLVTIPIHEGCSDSSGTKSESSGTSLSSSEESIETVGFGSEKSTGSSEKSTGSSEKSTGSSEKTSNSSEKTSNSSEETSNSSEKILELIKQNPKISAAGIAMEIGISSRGVEKQIKKLREAGIIKRNGADKGGYWEIINLDNN